jgi:signal transduction histidine kinase
VGLLVDNALRHGPDGQRVLVRVAASAGEAMLSVEDQGPGIRSADLPHIFDRFYRGPDAPPGGAGLGLAIARWIAERHGGALRVENLSAGGARFSASLPLG